MAKKATTSPGIGCARAPGDRSFPQNGTKDADYSATLSCKLGDQPNSRQRAWGGARNRADRVSYHISDEQASKLRAAAALAFSSSRVFQRHWTVHYGLAGIEPADATRFIGKLIDLVSKQARREGGHLSAIWVRECASNKGEHVHILMHLPAGMSLRNRTRRWIETAGGEYRRGVSKVTIVGGQLLETLGGGARAQCNAENVVRYMLKTTSSGPWSRFGSGGPVVGKRCGHTLNLAVRQRTGN